jgi:phosphoribulokinase
MSYRFISIVPVSKTHIKFHNSTQPLLDTDFNDIIRKISTDEMKIIIIRYYEPSNVYFLSTIDIRYKITKNQAAFICNQCKINKFDLVNKLDFDFKTIIRRMKIEQILNKFKQ